MVLRRLHQADAGIGEYRHQVLQPVRLHHIVGVDDADDFGVGAVVCEREPQCAGPRSLRDLVVTLMNLKRSPSARQ